MRQMITLWSNSASVLKSNAVNKASQSLGHGLATVAAILAERAQAPLQLVTECCVSLFSPVVVRQHPAQSAVQTTPGLPERPPP